MLQIHADTVKQDNTGSVDHGIPNFVARDRSRSLGFPVSSRRRAVRLLSLSRARLGTANSTIPPEDIDASR